MFTPVISSRKQFRFRGNPLEVIDFIKEKTAQFEFELTEMVKICGHAGCRNEMGFRNEFIPVVPWQQFCSKKCQVLSEAEKRKTSVIRLKRRNYMRKYRGKSRRHA